MIPSTSLHAVPLKSQEPLFDDPLAARLRGLGRRRRKREGHPDGETIRPVLRRKVPVALEIDIALISFGRREHEPDLRSKTKHASFEVAKPCTSAAVASDLLEVIADQSDVEILAHELRCAPIDMEVDAVLILEVRIDEIVRQAGHDGKFISGFCVEIRISSSAIDRHETEAEIGEPG